MIKGVRNSINLNSLPGVINDITEEYSKQKFSVVKRFNIKEHYCHIEFVYSADNSDGLKGQITFKVKTLLQLLLKEVAKRPNYVDYTRFAIHTYFTADLDLGMPVLLARILLDAGLDYIGHIEPSDEKVKMTLQESSYNIKEDDYAEGTLQYDRVYKLLREDAVIDAVLENNRNGENLTPELLIYLLQLNTLPVIHSLKDSLYNRYLHINGTSRHQFYPAYFDIVGSDIIFYGSKCSEVARIASVQFIRDIIAGLRIDDPITEIAWNNDIFKSQGVLDIFTKQLMSLAGVLELD